MDFMDSFQCSPLVPQGDGTIQADFLVDVPIQFYSFLFKFCYFIKFITWKAKKNERRQTKCSQVLPSQVLFCSESWGLRGPLQRQGGPGKKDLQAKVGTHSGCLCGCSAWKTAGDSVGRKQGEGG